MKDKLPINTDILRWSRTSIGLSLEKVAERMGKPVEKIEKWESGEESPTYPQLEDLAYKLYRRPTALFFFPEIPDEKTPESDFRSLPSALTRKLPTPIIRLYREAQIFHINLNELYEGINPAPRPIFKELSLKLGDNTAEKAQVIRDRFGISIESQKEWKNSVKAFSSWREALENTGIFIFKDGFRDDDYSGFCLYSEEFPIIFVNNTMPPNRQLFTLFHELAHILLKAGGIDFFNRRIVASDFGESYSGTERFCNEIAGEVLLPRREVNLSSLSISDESIEAKADEYSVSREVILRRLYDGKRINDEEYNSFIDKWYRAFRKKRRKEKESTVGNYYNTKKSYLGSKYIEQAFSKFYKHQITEAQLADYLFIKESE